MGRAAPLKNGVVVLGSGGMLGRAVCALLGSRGVGFAGVDRPAIDLADPASIRDAVPDGCPMVVNCAAYTDVDGAETDPASAWAANASGVGELARRCAAAGAVLVHYSTDYVFDGAGASPYRVDQRRAPLNAYGRSKADGEDAALASGAAVLIVRTSWLYAPWGKNFVRTIARLAGERPVLRVVNDQRGRPASAEQLARASLDLAASGVRGVAHATDAGECTWFELARAVVEGLGLPARVEPCASAEFPRPARRPAYSVLDISAAEAALGPLTHWRACLRDVLPRLERPL